MIEPREPSVEYIRELIDDADQKLKEFFSNKDATPRDINDEYFWIKQQLTDLIAVNNMLKKKEEEDYTKCGDHKLGCDCTNWETEEE